MLPSTLMLTLRILPVVDSPATPPANPPAVTITNNAANTVGSRHALLMTCQVLYTVQMV